MLMSFGTEAINGEPKEAQTAPQVDDGHERQSGERGGPRATETGQASFQRRQWREIADGRHLLAAVGRNFVPPVDASQSNLQE